MSLKKLTLAIFVVVLAISANVDGTCNRGMRLFGEGERVDINCGESCTCKIGNLQCAPMMCPDMLMAPCIFAQFAGECCRQVFCDVTASCTEPTNITLEEKEPRKFQRFPWTLVICADNSCATRYGAVILNAIDVLTFAPKFSSSQKLFLASKSENIDDPENDMLVKASPRSVASVKVHPDFADEDGKNNVLQIVRFNKSFLFTQKLMQANFPTSSDHCLNVSKDDCPLLAVGYDIPGDFGTLLAKKSTKNENSCKVTNASGKGEKRYCVGGFKDAKCSPPGGAVVATQGKAEFVVGLFDPIPDVTTSCKPADSIDVIPLCKYVDWIQQK